MNNDCEQVTISDIAKGVYDGPHATPKKTLQGPVFLGIGNLVDGRIDLSKTNHLSEQDYLKWTRRITPDAGDVVFSYETRLGDAGLIPKGLQCCLGRRMALIRPDRARIVPRFLLYTFLSPAFQEVIRKYTVHGSTVDRIPLLEFPNFPIRLPPIPEQHAIADILGSLDDKIELNRRMNGTLEQMAAAIFKAWFVDFEPVKAKANGAKRFPSMPQEVFDTLPTKFTNSPLGPIPKGWLVSTTGEELKVCGGGTPSTKKPEFWEGGMHHFATPKDLSKLSSPILLNTDRKVNDAGLAKISSGLLAEGTLLLSSRAPIGYLAIAKIPVAVNQGFIAMKCDGRLPATFMLNWCQQFMDDIKSRANGTTFLEVSKTNFRPMPISVPPDYLVNAFVLYAGTMYDRVTANLRESETLTEIRDVLLPKLLSGEIRVGEAERIAEEVA